MQNVMLFDILPDAKPSYEWRSGEMYEVEDEVLAPQIEAVGYQITGKWYSAEADSFGPLSRAIRVRKDGEDFVIWYG